MYVMHHLLFCIINKMSYLWAHIRTCLFLYVNLDNYWLIFCMLTDLSGRVS